MAGSEISAADSNVPLLRKKKSGYIWIQWTIASYFFVPKVRGVFQWCFLQEKDNLANDSWGHEEKWLLSLSAINCENRWKCLTSSFRKCKDNSNTSGHHICCAMFTLTRTAHLDRHFLCTQSELFRAFCTNHSYSRIVNKKTCSNHQIPYICYLCSFCWLLIFSHLSMKE